MSIFDKVIGVYDYAAMKLAEAQHAKGVTVRMNKKTFKTEYVNPDGTVVPNYEHFLKQTIDQWR